MTSGNNDTQSHNVSFATAWDPKTGRLFKADAIYLRGEANGNRAQLKVSYLYDYKNKVSQAEMRRGTAPCSRQSCSSSEDGRK